MALYFGKRMGVPCVSSLERKGDYDMSKMCIAVSIFRACTARFLATVLDNTSPGVDTVGSVWKERKVRLPKGKYKKDFKLEVRAFIVSLV